MTTMADPSAPEDELEHLIAGLRAIEDPEQRWERIRRAQERSQYRLAKLKRELIESMMAVPGVGVCEVARVVGCSPSNISKILGRPAC